jgi:hypothetical protein
MKFIKEYKMKLTEQNLTQVIKEELKLFLEQETDPTDDFIDYWEKERAEGRVEDGEQPDYDDVKLWAGNPEIAGHVWEELLGMRNI